MQSLTVGLLFLGFAVGSAAVDEKATTNVETNSRAGSSAITQRLPSGYRLAQSSDVKRRVAEQKRTAEQKRKEIEAKMQQQRAEHARRKEEFKRKYPQLRTNGSSKPLSRPSASRLPATAKQPPPPFDAANAATPEDCLNEFMAKARTAKSMNELIGYLPTAEQAALRGRQSSYDPALAVSRQTKYRQEGRLEDDSITFLTNSPYANALDRYGRLANKYIAVLGVEINDAKATITVSTHSDAIVNGVRYPYGTAKIDMVGEGRLWRFAGYNDSQVVYMHPPARRSKATTKKK